MNDTTNTYLEAQSPSEATGKIEAQRMPAACGLEKEATMQRAGLVLGNTAAGLGLGVAAGIGTIIVASVAEVVIPAFLIIKALGLTGGAFGFLRGIKK